MFQNWVKISPSDLRPDGRVEFRGVHVDVALSPYDIPDAVRGDYDELRQRFRIEFRYPDKEAPAGATVSNGPVELVVGQYSGKILSVLIDVDRHKLNAVSLALREHPISGFSSPKDRANKRGNFAAIDRLLQRRAEDLVPAGHSD